MAPSGMRFRPPAIAFGPELRWLMVAAFGPTERAAGAAAGARTDAAGAGERAARTVATPAIDPPLAVDLAERLGLAARLAARCGREALAARLGPDLAARVVRAGALATAQGMGVVAQAREVTALAGRIGIPIAQLKFAGLEAAGVEVVGRRGVADVDLLVPEGAAERLALALRERGWRVSELPAEEHHLPAMAPPDGGAPIEIHRCLLGVRLDGRRSATHADLAAAGLLRAAPGQPAGVSFLAPEVQAAHLLVHGLAQHGFWPAAYPLGRLFGDLIDLGLAEDGAGFLVAAFEPWVRQDLAAAEVGAALTLCRRLVRGEDPLAGGENDPASLLARHWFAGALDEGYARALRLGIFHSQPTDRSRGAQLVAQLRRALFLSPTEVEAIYGPQRSRWGTLGRQLARPFDLTRRLGRYLVDWSHSRTHR